jgi:hypothetical protein
MQWIGADGTSVSVELVEKVFARIANDAQGLWYGL